MVVDKAVKTNAEAKKNPTYVFAVRVVTHIGEHTKDEIEAFAAKAGRRVIFLLTKYKLKAPPPGFL